MELLLTSLMAFCLLVITSAAPTDTVPESTEAQRENHILAWEPHELSLSKEESEQDEDKMDDPELTAGYFQGDMVIATSRNGAIHEASRWPNHEVFYKISPTFRKAHKTYILKAMEEIMKVTCIEFIPATENTTNYVYILGSPRGCFSNVGYKNQIQILNLKVSRLGTGCFRLGRIMHEMMHTLGFFHQQSSYDRDEFVKIVKENIDEKYLHNFDMYTTENITNFGVAYDYGSIMHYGSRAFSVNGEKTIETLQPNQEIGQRVALSSSDIKKINIMYKCQEIKEPNSSNE